MKYLLTQLKQDGSIIIGEFEIYSYSSKQACVRHNSGLTGPCVRISRMGFLKLMNWIDDTAIAIAKNLAVR